MNRLTFTEVGFIAFVMMLWSDADAFMDHMRGHHVEWFIRYPVGFACWLIYVGIAAFFWRMIFGKGRW